jgi:urease accessory protein
MRLPVTLIALLLPATALAHTGRDHGGGFASGLSHPLLGPDHLLAMIAVGLWAGLWGGRALIAYPVTFLAAMLAGGLIGVGGAELPVVEPAILASVIVLGALVALAFRVPMAVSVAGLALFGLAHGYAHGVEGPGSTGYALGFVIATAALHGLGIALARLGIPATRALGGAVAVAGVALVFV